MSRASSISRILIVHNGYRHRGGEDAVVEAEVDLLRAHGHDVEIMARHNDELDSLSALHAASETLWSRRTTTSLQETINRFAPHIVHFHNTFPLISPSGYWTAAANSLPVIQTLHNYRLHCPQAMYLRNGSVCEDCVGRLPWPAVIRKCYRDSTAQTGALVAMLMLHRALGSWRNKVTRFIALSEFSRQKFIEGGLPADRVVVKPNFADFPAPAPSRRAGFLFVGRLSQEKGLKVLARAWTQATLAEAGVSLVVVGSGPESGEVVGIPGMLPLGAQPRDAVRGQMERAVALVIPSICYENFPMTLVEAFANGLPVIASNMGAMAALVEDGVTGLLYRPGDARDLAEKLRWAHAHHEHMADMGRRARLTYESRYSPEQNYGQLMSIYADAIAAAKPTKRP